MNNKDGFTMLEVVISISIGAIVLMTLFLIPRNIATSHLNYKNEATFTRETERIMLVVNRDLLASNAKTPISNDNRASSPAVQNGELSYFEIYMGGNNYVRYESRADDGLYRVEVDGPYIKSNIKSEEFISKRNLEFTLHSEAIYIDFHNRPETHLLVVEEIPNPNRDTEKQTFMRLEFPVHNDKFSRIKGETNEGDE